MNELTPEQMAKLSPEERAAIIEEEKRQTKQALKLSLGGLLLAALLFSLLGLGSQSDSRKIRKVESYVEKCDFAKARTTLEKIQGSANEGLRADYRNRITKAEVSYFIDEGDYLKAYDCAKENNMMDYYQSTIVSRIPKVYEKEGASALIRYLGAIVTPAENAYGYGSFVKSYNAVLSNLIKSIEVDGKKEEAATLKKMLK